MAAFQGLCEHARRMATRPALTVRRGADRKIAGVCSGLAEAGGVDPWVVRIGFLLLAVAGGIGVALYVALMLVLPDSEQGSDPIAWRAVTPLLRRPAGAGLLVWGALLLFSNLGGNLSWGLPVGLACAAASITLAWEAMDDAGRALVRGRASRLGGRQTLLRLVVGGTLVAIGLGTMLGTGSGFSVLRQVLLAAAVTIGGLALILYPWIRGLLDDLADERRARIRSEERAEVAAHVHDSVLQTLALIQRNADRPRELVTLARRQERELRSWLYGTGDAARPDTLVGAFEAMAADVEAVHGVEVDVVVVGECPVDGDVEALVKAAREAAVNAAKHSGATVVSVYVEAEPDKVTAFVRDRGKGFDPAAVPDDRRGIVESIEHRLQRHGGTATISSAPGEGTEVMLEIRRRGGG